MLHSRLAGLETDKYITWAVCHVRSGSCIKHVVMESGTSIYLSCRITSGAKLIVAPKLVRIVETNTFSDLLEKVEPSAHCITSILICKNEKFIRSECLEVILEADLAFCRQFSPLEPYKFVSFLVSPDEPKEKEKSSTEERPNVFSQFMKKCLCSYLACQVQPISSHNQQKGANVQ